MAKLTDVQQGWEFAAKLVGSDLAGHLGAEYVDAVEAAISRLEDSINNHAYRGQDVAHFQGYVQEAWHAGTFNIDAVASGSDDVARTLDSHGKWSVDIALDSGKEYSAKSISTGAKSGIAQAAFNPDTGKAGYDSQGRLVPEDHLEAAKAEVHRRAGRNILTRPDVAEAYSETEGQLTDRISNDEGVESKPATRKQLEEMAQAGKEQKFNAEDAGVSSDSAIKTEYLIKQALKAGYTSAAITVALQLAPEIYKAIDYLIRHGELDVTQLKRMGEKAITAGAEGFIRGTVSCSLLIMCEKGVFGEVLKGIDPTILGSVVAIVMQTVKNSILVAAGKMTSRQMGSAFVDSIIVSGGYIIGAKLGGIIGQALGWELPVVGYLLGSLIGTAFAIVYNIGKKKLISFCVDTGFTCFGLVEQNYELPEDVLKEMGVTTIPIDRTEISKNEISTVNPLQDIERTDYETIDITVLRRGVIGINKVGYVLA